MSRRCNCPLIKDAKMPNYSYLHSVFIFLIEE
jgi:hypothetical protein